VVFHSRTADAPYEPLFVGGNVIELTGFSADDFLASAEFGISRVHPDDVDIVVRAQARPASPAPTAANTAGSAPTGPTAR
jgi:hypothetical protein